MTVDIASAFGLDWLPTHLSVVPAPRAAELGKLQARAFLLGVSVIALGSGVRKRVLTLSDEGKWVNLGKALESRAGRAPNPPRPPSLLRDDIQRILGRLHDNIRGGAGLSPMDAADALLGLLIGYSELRRSGAPTGRAEFAAAGPTEVAILESWLAYTRRIVKARDHALAQIGGDVASHTASFARQLPPPILLSVARDLEPMIDLMSSDSDVLSDTLMVFLDGTLRKYGGIYHTPSELVAAIVSCADVQHATSILDPAAGSGTFLRAAARLNPRASLIGYDVDSRAVLLSRVGLLAHPGDVEVSVRNGIDRGAVPAVDIILTNPPFGVKPLPKQGALFEAGDDLRGLPSEVVFVNRGLQMLRPGGAMWIVLPRSVLTNKRLGQFRASVDATAAVRTVIELPSDTFAPFGATVSTVVIELVRRPTSARSAQGDGVAIIKIRNVGYDGTGRRLEGSELPALPARRAAALWGGVPVAGDCRLPVGTTLEAIFGSGNSQAAAMRSHGVRLGDLCMDICNGATPARSAYTDSGQFIVKVGNLTGRGVNWTPRQRNFIPPEVMRRRIAPIELGDILLTSAAHVARYIGLKVDIVTEIPGHLARPVTFTAELLRVRVDPTRVDPLSVYAWLRSNDGYQAIQALVRGQTAHLYAQDVAEIRLDLEDLGRRFTPTVLHELSSVLATEQELQRAWRRLGQLMGEQALVEAGS